MQAAFPSFLFRAVKRCDIAEASRSRRKDRYRAWIKTGLIPISFQISMLQIREMISSCVLDSHDSDRTRCN